MMMERPPLQYILKYNDKSPQEISVKIKSKNEWGFGPSVENISWSWIDKNSVVLEDNWVRPEFRDNMSDYVRARTQIIDTVEWSRGFSNLCPEIVIISTHASMAMNHRQLFSNESILKEKKWDNYINIQNPGKNYLNVVVDSELKVSYYNQIVIDPIESLTDWYPHKLRIKKTNNKLILLNNDGSESRFSVDIIYDCRNNKKL